MAEVIKCRHCLGKKALDDFTSRNKLANSDMIEDLRENSKMNPKDLLLQGLPEDFVASAVSGLEMNDLLAGFPEELVAKLAAKIPALPNTDNMIENHGIRMVEAQHKALSNLLQQACEAGQMRDNLAQYRLQYPTSQLE